MSARPGGDATSCAFEDGKARGDGVLALGDPDYETAAPARAAGVRARGVLGRLTRLPATADEARAVGGTVLLGRAATERGLREAVAKRPRWRAVHFACHGLLDAERPAFSSLALTAADDDDGFLSVLEVFRARFPADLVVPSACEAAKGKVVDGEGILGLTRAFMFAGAPRVICSPWKVADEATRALMTKFYELWSPRRDQVEPRAPSAPAAPSGASGASGASTGRGLATAEALRRAQAFVRSQERWKHPSFWAAWVLWGLGD